MQTPRAANPWLDRRVFHWAHQGGAKEGPSNTIWAMRTARDVGAQGLEFDVHRSEDGRVVVIHDATLHRTTDRSGWVADHSAAQLAGFDAAHWWVKGEVDNHNKGTPKAKYVLRGQVEKNPELGIPTVDEVLHQFGNVPLTIEIKDGRAVEPLVKLVRHRQIPTEDLIVTSFNDAIVEQLSRQAPEIPLAPGAGWTWKFFLRARFGLPLPRSSYVAIQVPHHPVGKDLHVLPEVVRRLRPSWLRLTVVTPRLVRAAHRAGLAVHVWTIDDENEMCELVDLGVDGIMTDRPSLLARVLERGP